MLSHCSSQITLFTYQTTTLGIQLANPNSAPEFQYGTDCSLRTYIRLAFQTKITALETRFGVAGDGLQILLSMKISRPKETSVEFLDKCSTFRIAHSNSEANQRTNDPLSLPITHLEKVHNIFLPMHARRSIVQFQTIVFHFLRSSQCD